MDGEGVEKNESEGFALFKKLAYQGSGYGMTNVGWAYQDGKGVDQNYA